MLQITLLGLKSFVLLSFFFLMELLALKKKEEKTPHGVVCYHKLYRLGGSDGKESTCNVGDLGLVPGLGRSPGRGHGNPHQCS